MKLTNPRDGGKVLIYKGQQHVGRRLVQLEDHPRDQLFPIHLQKKKGTKSSMDNRELLKTISQNQQNSQISQVIEFKIEID